MKFGRYLIVMVSSWLLGAAVVVGFILLVDPIGISPIRIAIAGFNTFKPLQQDYDWIVKRYDVRRNQPATIFMGSSRIKQSMDPKLVAKTGFAPAYNGGLNGSANFSETKAYLRGLSQGRQEFASCLHRGIRDGSTRSIAKQSVRS